MKKKLVSLALVLVMALTLFPTAALAAEITEPDPPPLSQQADAPDALPADASSAEDSPAEAASAETTPAEAAPAEASPAEAAPAEASPAEATPAEASPSDAAPADTSPSDAASASCNGQADCSAGTHDPTCLSLCTKAADCSAVSHQDGCPKAAASSAGTGGTDTSAPPAVSATPSACNHTESGGTLTRQNTPKAATCNTPGEKAYYECSVCHLLFIAGSLNTAYTKITPAALTIPATGAHTPPSSFAASDISDTRHTYTCQVCHTAGITEAHTYGSDGVCSVCGFQRTVSPSYPYRYIDITSAYVNSYSITVTWTSDAAGGTPFDIYVDGVRRASDVRPSKSSGYFTYTVEFSHYLDDSYYSVAVYLSGDRSVSDSTQVYGRYYDRDYYRPSYGSSSTPGTNSSGIPYASQVTGRYSASEAIRILRNSNHNSLQYDLIHSSSALSSFESLERAVKNANNVAVSVDIDRSAVPSAFRSGISITGAAFNASRTNSTVRLVVDAPSQNRYVGHGYQFSMTLTGVDSAYSLDVPVVVTLPLPSDINSSYVQVLHYHGSGSPSVIVPKVSGRTITFPLTGFSDFVVTDNGPYYGYGGYVSAGYVSDGYGYVPVTAFPGQPARRSLMEEHLRIVLPILATLPPDGYVYNDVSNTYWAAAEIAWARDSGIMSGYYDGNFRPDGATTRQELWMALARLAGANPTDMWSAQQWAISVGITDGTDPYAALSRQQMIATLYRYAQYLRADTTAPLSNLSYYRDGASVAPYARAAMSWAVNWGIAVPDSANRLNPEDLATRADFAVYLCRFLK